MVKIYKLSGTGNTFLLIDLRTLHDQKLFKKYFPKISRKSVARQLCNPSQSIGSDGLLFLENSQSADLKWDFYNADGSSAEMCGNAARCVGRYILSRPNPPPDFTLETGSGIICISLPLKPNYKFCEPAIIEVEMPMIGAYQPNQKILIKKRYIHFDFINSGVPHAVVKLPPRKKIKSIIENVDKLGEIVSKIRALRIFSKTGTNVTFYSAQSRNLIESLTFERGVSGYTQACGTGAVAAAVSFAKNKQSQIKIKVPGGLLMVNLTKVRPHLIGLGQIVAEISLR